MSNIFNVCCWCCSQCDAAAHTHASQVFHFSISKYVLSLPLEYSHSYKLYVNTYVFYVAIVGSSSDIRGYVDGLSNFFKVDTKSSIIAYVSNSKDLFLI